MDDDLIYSEIATTSKSISISSKHRIVSASILIIVLSWSCRRFCCYRMGGWAVGYSLFFKG